MPTTTSSWLDSVEELSTMDTSPDSNTDRHLFKVLGALGSDMKHSLSLLERGRQDTNQLRMDIKQDLSDIRVEFSRNIDKLRSDHESLSDRVDKLETFQTKIMAWAAILLPLAIIVGQILAPVVLGLL